MMVESKSVFKARGNTESANKMYTHFNRWYLCIVFEVELKYHYNMWYGVFSTDVTTRMTIRSHDACAAIPINT